MEFTSALPYAKVRDFAYHDKHPLHYGARPISDDQQHFDEEGLDNENDFEESYGDEDQPNAEDDEQYVREGPDAIYSRAVALFDFEPENSNEIKLVGGQVVWISYRHGQGWLVAENLETGETGLVPEEYVQVLPESESEWEDAN